MPVFQLDHMLRDDMEIRYGIPEYVVQDFSHQNAKFNEIELKTRGYQIPCVVILADLLLLSTQS